MVRRFEIHLIALDPTLGAEIQKTRPCVIISPDEMNQHLRTVIIAPMTSKGLNYPTNIPLTFQGKKGRIVLGQLRTVDKNRLIKKLGKLNEATALHVCARLQEMFEP